MTRNEWYDNLAKPSWTPNPATIGLIWQILYPIILVSFGFVIIQAIRKKLPWILASPFAITAVPKHVVLPLPAANIVYGFSMVKYDLKAVTLGGK